jgi:hypothetical protein
VCGLGDVVLSFRFRMSITSSSSPSTARPSSPLNPSPYVSKSQEDLNIETTFIREKYQQLLKTHRPLTSLGPNATPPAHRFGSQAKITTKTNKDTIDLNLKHLENWKKYNELGQTCPRERVQQNYGKLLETPGPGEYTPNEQILSTNEPSYKYSLHGRPSYQPVDRVETPGPGTYESHSGLRVEFERFKRDPLPEMLPTKCTNPFLYLFPLLLISLLLSEGGSWILFPSKISRVWEVSS